MRNTNYSIAIDGPAGAGKSTVAKRIATILNLEYIDTGAMYRALTLKVMRNGKDPQNMDEVIQVFKDTTIDFNNNHIYLDGEIVDKEIRDNEINKNVSYIAIIKEVREGMVSLQQEMAKTKSVIMDGRDISTVVLTNAEFKFFVTASPEERARRRYKELRENGKTDITLEQIIGEIERRDYIDSNREIAPLKLADDAILINTDNLSIEEVVNKIIRIVEGGN
ncbi:MAG: (d)CMP kinase [Tissierellia bacterium]|jgi:cytidylate kinase|nr:(d)CMP kinase [Tissierellia bacterium]